MQSLNNHTFAIIDICDHLELVHYPTKWGKITDPGESWWVRGLVLDTRIDKIIAGSYGHTAEVADIIPEGAKLFKGHEGALIRIYLNNGEVRMSSHRRISLDKSRWGSSSTFLEMINSDEACTSQRDSLFDLTKKESPYCYMFLLRHPELMCCSLEQVDKAMLTYLGCTTSYTKEDALFPEEDVDWNQATIAEPEPITEEVALNHLKKGYGARFEDDSILGGGEFVIASSTDESGRVKLTKVTSAAYRWRASIVDNNPNIVQRLCQLVSYARGAKHELQLPELTKNQVDKIKLSCLPSSKLKLSYLYITLYSSICWYWLALPVGLRDNLEDVAHNYIREVRLLVEHICTLHEAQSELDEKTPLRIKEIIDCAVKHNKGDMKSKVKFLISKEFGTSLYRLVRYRIDLFSELTD